MEQLLQEITPYLISIGGVLLTYLGHKVNQFVNAKIDKDKQAQVKDIVKGVVAFVEQVSKVNVEMLAHEKYELAKEKALLILNEKGLTVGEEELNMLIESFVLGLKGE